MKDESKWGPGLIRGAMRALLMRDMLAKAAAPYVLKWRVDADRRAWLEKCAASFAEPVDGVFVRGADDDDALRARIKAGGPLWPRGWRTSGESQ
jgi:hypothetical protein